jgi:serine protease AprX
VAAIMPNEQVQMSSYGAAASNSQKWAWTIGAPVDWMPQAGQLNAPTIAIIDSGIDASRGDFANRVLGQVNFSSLGSNSPGDGYGHGTFVAGLIAGSGSSSHGAYAGVAPGASILDVRVAHDDGSTTLVEVLEGLQVVADHPEVDVLNLSLASDSPLPYQLDPLTQALETLWRRGVLVVVPAGNDGDQGHGSIASPGIDPTVLTVGGLDTAGTVDRSDDTVAPWSSQGPAPQGVLKPDLVAPGAHVVSTGAPGSVVWQDNPASRVAGGYLTGSGTSFATAVASGSAAALLDARPALSPDRVKDLLVATAYHVPGTRLSAGAGGTDLATALQQASRGHGQGDGDNTHVHGRQLPPAQAGDVTDVFDANAWAANAWAARQWAARQWAARQWSTVQWQ